MGGHPPWCGSFSSVLAPTSLEALTGGCEQDSGLVWAEPAGGPPEQGLHFATCQILKPPILCFSAFVSQDSATMHLPATIGKCSLVTRTGSEQPGGPRWRVPAS